MWPMEYSVRITEIYDYIFVLIFKFYAGRLISIDF